MPEPVDLRIDPVRVDSRRGGGGWRVAAVAGLAIAFVGLALVKPWDPADTRPSQAAVPSPGRGDSLAPDEPVVAYLAPRDRARLIAAVEPHERWGLRAIVLERGAFAERWVAAEPLADGIDADRERLAGDRAVRLPTVTLPTRSQPVVALGLTGPDAEVPLDVRVWRLVQGRVPERIVPRAVPVEPGRSVWLPRGPDGLSQPSWEPGTYRIDLLMGAHIHRLAVRVPGDAPDAAPPDSMAVGPLDPGVGRGLAEALAIAPYQRTEVGGFVGVGDIVRPIPPATGRAANELTAWVSPLAPDAGRWARWGGRVVAPSADVLGWVVERGGEPLGSRVLMLGPIERTFVIDDDAVEVPDPDRPGLTRTAMVLRWATGHPWPAGVYRIETGWRAADGSIHRASWHADLVPARDGVGLPSPLVRLVGALSAEPGIAVGRPPAARLSDYVLAVEDLLTPVAAADPARACAGRPIIDDDEAAIAITTRSPAPVDGFTLERLFDGGIRHPARAGLVPAAAPGLALVVPPPGGWEPGAYAVGIVRTGGRDELLACIGDGTGSGIWFDPATTEAPR